MPTPFGMVSGDEDLKKKLGILLGGAPDVQAPPVQEAAATPAPTSLPVASTPSPALISSPSTPALPPVTIPPVETPQNPQLAKAQNELTRLKSTGSGISQIHNPILKTLARIGDIAGTAFFPGVTSSIPGTELHHRQLVNQQVGNIAEDEAEQQKSQQAEQQAVQTRNLAVQPQLEQQKTEAAGNKNLAAHELALRKLGMQTGPNGDLQPIPYENLSSAEQAKIDLQTAQGQSANAKAALDHIKSDPTSPQNQAILARVRVMAQNAATAAEKLGLDKTKFVADYFGLDQNGNPLPGAAQDTQGHTIGPRIANAGAPTAMRLNKSDLARNVQTNVQEMNSLIDQNPNLFGKVAGRFTSFEQMIGSDDPAISRLGVAGHNAAMASNGIHGLRSAEAVAGTEKMLLNHFRNGPDATKAALNEMSHSVGTFIDDAMAGKKALPSPLETPQGAPPTPVYAKNPKTGERVMTTDGGKTWVPAK